MHTFRGGYFQMKCRLGFVSNSSSASFILNTINVSDKQKKMIYKHIDAANALEFNFDEVREWKSGGVQDEVKWEERDKWHIKEDYGMIEGTTFMDNFPMDKFLVFIGIHPRAFRIWND